MSVFYVDRFHSGLEQVNSRLYISGLGVTAAQLLKPVLMKAREWKQQLPNYVMRWGR